MIGWAVFGLKSMMIVKGGGGGRIGLLIEEEQGIGHQSGSIPGASQIWGAQMREFSLKNENLAVDGVGVDHFYGSVDWIDMDTSQENIFAVVEAPDEEIFH